MGKPWVGDWQRLARYVQLRRNRRIPLRVVIGVAMGQNVWVEVGQYYPDTAGKRLLLEANYNGVFFLQNGVLYEERAADFLADLESHPFIQAGLWSLCVVRLVELEVKFVLALAGGVCPPIATLVFLTDAGQFCAEHREDLPRWYNQLTAILASRRVLKLHARFLYEKLFDKVWRDTMTAALTAENYTADDVVELLAGLLASLGSVRELTRRLAIIGLGVRSVADVVKAMVKVGAMPTVKDYATELQELTTRLRAGGITILEHEKPALLQDLQRLREHESEFRLVREKLEAAFPG